MNMEIDCQTVNFLFKVSLISVERLSKSLNK